MKNIFKTILCLITVFSFNSCEEDLVILDLGQFAQLSDASATSITENSGDTVTIEVILASPSSTDTTVSFEATGADASRYSLSATSLTIPAGDTAGEITFMAIDNDTIDGDVTVNVALASSSDVPVGIGGEGVNNVSKDITIVDDNVPCNNILVSVTTDRWGDETSWDILDSNGVRVADGGPYVDLGEDANETYESNVFLEDGCYTFRIFDFWGDGMDDGSYAVTCGNLTHATGEGSLDGIPGLDVSTVLNPFRAASGNNVDPYIDHAEATDFCVNQ